MKKSKHPGRLQKVAQSTARNTKAVTGLDKAATVWSRDAKVRATTILSLGVALKNKVREINDYVEAYVDVVRQITEKEAEWDRETDDKKKKKIEGEHKKLEKTADGMIKDLNTRHLADMTQLHDSMIEMSTIPPVKS